MKRLMLLLLLCVLAGCEAKPLYGTIVRKIYRPAWTEVRMQKVGKSEIPLTIHHPPEWNLVIQKEGTQSDEGQQLIIVGEETYKRLEVGRTWYRADTVIETK